MTTDLDRLRDLRSAADPDDWIAGPDFVATVNGEVILRCVGPEERRSAVATFIVELAGAAGSATERTISKTKRALEGMAQEHAGLLERLEVAETKVKSHEELLDWLEKYAGLKLDAVRKIRHALRR